MLRFAFANLLSRPGRTTLSTLGLTIAIAGMVGLFAIASGIDDMLEESLGEVPGVVVLQPGAPIPLFSTLPAVWAEEMQQIEGVHVVTTEAWARVNMLDGKNVFSPPRLLMGIDIPTRLQLDHGVYPDKVEAGRFLNVSDIGHPNIVVSRQIADDLRKGVGDQVQLNGKAMSIVGVYHTGALITDMTILAPIDVVRTMARIDPGTVSCFYIEQMKGVAAETLVERVQQTFAGREPSSWQPSALTGFLANPGEAIRDLMQRTSEEALRDPKNHEPVAEADDADPPLALEVYTVAQFGDRFNDLSMDLDLILGLLTGLGMLIAVFSILNTMLMSVTERTIEFGILRANGWSQSDVIRLITCESALIGLSGGVLGVLLGWIGTQVINSVWSDRAHLYAGPMLLAFSLLFSIAVGMVGGLYPALRAARMSPMQAIRRG